MKHLFKIAWLLPFLVPLQVSAQFAGMGNPSAIYCNQMGYKYEITTDEKGNQDGRCILPDGKAVNGWDFFRGKVGREFSYCAKKGFDIETEVKDQGGFTTEKPVCVRHENGKETGRWDMMEMMMNNGDWPGVEKKKE